VQGAVEQAGVTTLVREHPAARKGSGLCRDAAPHLIRIERTSMGLNGKPVLRCLICRINKLD
jgi:hypothetical protein